MPLIVVTVGTDVHPFDRLVQWVDRWVAEHPEPRPRVVVQHGRSAPPSTAEGHDLVGHDDLQRLLAGAIAVVTHGGPATITEARRHGRVPVVVPREHAHGEHVDDHQVRFATRLGQVGLVRLCRTEDGLRSVLDSVVDDPELLRVPTGASGAAAAAAVARVGDVADRLATRSAPPRPAEDAVPVLYVGGLGRSGSTLVERLLAQMPDVCSTGETVHLWERALRADERCGCGMPFSACPFWRKVGDRAFDGWERVDPDEIAALHSRVDRTRNVPRLALSRLPAAARADLESYTGYYTALYEAVREVSGTQLVIDSSKHASLAFALRWAPGVDLRVLHLVRDSRGVAYSWSKTVRRPDISRPDGDPLDGSECVPPADDLGGGAFMARYDPMKVSGLWLAENAAFHLLRRTGVPVLTVRYEDLLADPAPVLRKIRQFAGLPDAPAALDFLDGRTARLEVDHTASGNPMRFTTGDVSLRTDDAWRERLPTPRRRAVSALTLPLRLRYGYTGRLGRPQ